MIKNLECYVNDQKIYAEAYIPDTDDENYPTVILSHGFSLDHTTMKPYADKLLKHNIASIIYDFRGGGFKSKSDGKMTDMSILTEVEDLNALIELVLSCDFVDKDQLYLAGHSQGGLVTTLVAPDHMEHVQSLFLFAPGFNIPNDIKKLKIAIENGLVDPIPGVFGKDYLNSVQNIELYDDITGYTKEVYIFHGKNDDRVPLKSSEEAVNVYEKSELIVYDDKHRFEDSTKDLVVDKIADVIASNM